MQVVPRCRSLGEKIHWRFTNNSKKPNCSCKCRCSMGSVFEDEDLMKLIINVFVNFLLPLLHCRHLWMVKVITEKESYVLILRYQLL